MRISVLRKSVYAAVVVAAAVSVSYLATSPQSSEDMGDMGAFIQQLDGESDAEEDAPVSGLEVFLKSMPKEAKKVAQKKKSQPNVATFNCDKFDGFVRKHGNDEFALIKAQMKTESSCNPDAQGEAGDMGLLQVRKPACNEVGVRGNLLDPETNIKCAARYLRRLCSHYGWCAMESKLVAYNVGPTGAKFVRDHTLHAYPKKVKKFLTGV